MAIDGILNFLATRWTVPSLKQAVNACWRASKTCWPSSIRMRQRADHRQTVARDVPVSRVLVNIWWEHPDMIWA